MSKKRRAIVSVTNDLFTDQRVNKVCCLLVEQGYDVMLIGRKKKSSQPLLQRTYKMKRMRLLFEKGPLFYTSYNFRLFLYLIFHRANLLVSNDLDTLLANFLAFKFKRRCRLVYDSHELFTEVPELTDRPKIQKIWLRIEAWIFPKLETIYTVNKSIADIYSEKYGNNISVVRNISPVWHPDKLKTKMELGIPENVPLLILQGAGINIQRGAEEAVEAMRNINAVLMIVGDGDVVTELREYVTGNHLSEKVLFYGKKPYNEMMNYTYHADIGLTLDKPQSKNYEFSLPNKVFDYIHAGTPIIATNIKEVTAIINKYGIGEIVDPLTVENLTAKINGLLSSNDKLESYKNACFRAGMIENWENEVRVLKQIYPKVD